MSEFTFYVGIDLGNTQQAICVLDGCRKQVLQRVADIDHAVLRVVEAVGDTPFEQVAVRYLPTTLRQVAVEFSGRGPPPPRARNPRVASPSPSSSSPPLRFAPFLRATMTRVAATKPALAG